MVWTRWCERRQKEDESKCFGRCGGGGIQQAPGSVTASDSIQFRFWPPPPPHPELMILWRGLWQLISFPVLFSPFLLSVSRVLLLPAGYRPVSSDKPADWTECRHVGSFSLLMPMWNTPIQCIAFLLVCLLICLGTGVHVCTCPFLWLWLQQKYTEEQEQEKQEEVKL